MASEEVVAALLVGMLAWEVRVLAVIWAAEECSHLASLDLLSLVVAEGWQREQEEEVWASSVAGCPASSSTQHRTRYTP